MIIAYLLFGLLFGAGAAALTLLNGGGLLLALVAYSSGGALAILGPLLAMAIVDAFKVENGDWDEKAQTNGPISA